MNRHARIVSLLLAIVAALGVAGLAAADGGVPTPPDLPPGGVLPAGGVVVGNTIVFPDGTGIVLAPADYNDCPSGDFCLWMNQNYTGALIYTGTRSTWYNISSYPNDAESARNNSTHYGQVATEQNGAGSRQCHNPGGHFASLGGTFNNNVESYALWASGGCI